MSTIITHRQFPNYHKYEMELAGRPLTLEVGKLAELANAAVMVGYGDTRVLVCATASARPRDGIDFFPLSVDFEEKLYSVGRIPGSFNRREGRPGEKGILTSRVIDRPIRPLFPSDFRNDVSIMATVMSVDHDCSPEIAALIGTSAALAISDIPWNGPVGALKVGLVNGELVLNPNSEQRKVSDLDVTVVSTGKKVVMIEAGANEVPNDVMFEAIRMAHEENQKQIALINQMVAEIGKPKFDYPHASFNQELFDKIVENFMDEAKAAMDTDDKNVREARWNEMIEHWHEKFLEEYPDMDQFLDEITYKFQKKIVKQWLLEGHRVDGRQQRHDVRQLRCADDCWELAHEKCCGGSRKHKRHNHPEHPLREDDAEAACELLRHCRPLLLVARGLSGAALLLGCELLVCGHAERQEEQCAEDAHDTKRDEDGEVVPAAQEDSGEEVAEDAVRLVDDKEDAAGKPQPLARAGKLHERAALCGPDAAGPDASEEACGHHEPHDGVRVDKEEGHVEGAADDEDALLADGRDERRHKERRDGKHDVDHATRTPSCPPATSAGSVPRCTQRRSGRTRWPAQARR